MERTLEGYSCNLEGYMPRILHTELTWEDAIYAYHLIPTPPLSETGSMDDYIRKAQETHDLKYIFFYLHMNERYFNKKIYAFLMADTGNIVPQRFMDLKLECRLEVLRRFPAYDPHQGLSFLTYIHHFITDAMLRNRMTEENYSFGSLYEYKTARRIMQIYHTCKENSAETIRIYAEQTDCSEETAAEKLKAAWEQRNRLFPEINEVDEEEPYEELLPDEWDYAGILEDSIEADKIDKAFHHLSYRDQALLEQRNAICMRCGRVSDMKKRASFETLAALFEGSGASGAERAYKRAIENLTLELVKLGQLHCVCLKKLSTQREGKKITAAAYAYQVDNGGAWGEIQFDLEKGTAWVEIFAENDPCDTWEITDAAIKAVLTCNADKMPKKMLIPTLDFQLPVENVQEIEMDVRKTVLAGDIPVSLDRVVLTPTRLDTQVELFYHADSGASAEQLLEFRFIAVDPSSLDYVDAGSYSDGPEILGAENQNVYLHDAWTIGGPLDMNRLYLQLLPVYTWAKEGVERNQGLKDVQIIEINISEKRDGSGRK